MAVGPLWVLPPAHVFIPDEPMTRQKVLGFLIGFLGVDVLIGPGALARSDTAIEVWAQLACIGAAACYAISSIITRLVPPSNQISFSAAGLSVATTAILPVALLREELASWPSGSALWAVLVMDNATFHRRADTIEIIARAGHSLEYLPPYSLDLNPTEHKWAQAKARRRKTGVTVGELFRTGILSRLAIGEAAAALR